MKRRFRISKQQRTIMQTLKEWPNPWTPLAYIREKLGFGKTNSENASLSRSMKRLRDRELIQCFNSTKLYSLTVKSIDFLTNKLNIG